MATHAMLREIHEQPAVLRATLATFTSDGGLIQAAFRGAEAALRGDSLLIAASGSSRHAGLVGKVLFEELAGLRCDVEYASEWIALGSCPARQMLVLSQSGETADTLEALRSAQGATIAITNNEGSSMSLVAGCSIVTPAGKERAIPATKSFTAQLMVLELLALFAGQLRGKLTAMEVSERIAELHTIPERMERSFAAWDEQIALFLPKMEAASLVIFLGRGVHLPIAQEGALKLKESAYLPAEAYPSGEFKHGPAALLAPGVPLVALAGAGVGDAAARVRREKTLALVGEMRELGAAPLVVVAEGVSELAMPLLEVVPLQLLAYHAAVQRGIDVDRPRNLNKAVLVE